MKHKMENVPGYIPEKQQDLVQLELWAIFCQTSREKADRLGGNDQMRVEFGWTSTVSVSP